MRLWIPGHGELMTARLSRRDVPHTITWLWFRTPVRSLAAWLPQGRHEWQALCWLERARLPLARSAPDSPNRNELGR